MKEIINFLKPYTTRAYLVGGASRDILMGKIPTDFDIEIYDISPQFFEKLMLKLGAKGVGKSFFVYKYKNFDLSLPRIENKNGYGHTGFEVKITQNEKTASIRRDFTINSIMINIFTNEILDFWGGKEDIKNKIIKLIDKNKFKEDSLRVLRAMQFSARFGFKIDKNTIQVCKNIDLSDLSLDRIYKEFEKMLRTEETEKIVKKSKISLSNVKDGEKVTLEELFSRNNGKKGRYEGFEKELKSFFLLKL